MTTHEQYIYSTLFKTEERESDRRSKEIEQRKESQNTHTNKTTRTRDTKYILISKQSAHHMNNHIYSTLFKTEERESDRRSKEIHVEQRKESQNTHTNKTTRTCDPKY